MDFNKIKEAAQNYEADMTKFLREIVKFPGESCGEKDHIERIAEEMRKLDFDKVEIDPQGNVLGYMGTGETLIGFDAHIDTVGIGNRDNWEFDPYEGFVLNNLAYFIQLALDGASDNIIFNSSSFHFCPLFDVSRKCSFSFSKSINKLFTRIIFSSYDTLSTSLFNASNNFSLNSFLFK